MERAIECARSAEEQRAQMAAEKERAARAELLSIPATVEGAMPAQSTAIEVTGTSSRSIVPAHPTEGRFVRGWHLIKRGLKEMFS